MIHDCLLSAHSWNQNRTGQKYDDTGELNNDRPKMENVKGSERQKCNKSENNMIMME